ncbi:hypothetical protein WMY93_010079 [Mugilogobius chulae]|uniref:Uncharacterized protein n=1 Tax=Mugilogobius chulae TaxID=88201 RepID=A0AAW0P6F1_9GOBI
MLTFIQRRASWDHSDLQSLNQHQAQPITDAHTAQTLVCDLLDTGCAMFYKIQDDTGWTCNTVLKPVNWDEILFEEPDKPDFPFLELSEFNIEEGSASPHSRDRTEQTEPNPHDPHSPARSGNSRSSPDFL